MRFNFKNCLLSLSILISFVAKAQNGLNFQGVARNSNNVILASQPISLRLSIVQGTTNAVTEYTEVRKVTTNAQGLFNVVIGDTGTISVIGSFSTIDWKLTPKFLKIEMDVAAGNNFSLIGTTQFQSVAYAQFAIQVDAEKIIGVVPVAKGGTGVASITALKASLDLDTKVDKVTGKDLSTNDYTTAEKTKLAAITGTNTGDQDLSAYATTAYVDGQVNAVRVQDGAITTSKIANNAVDLTTKVSSLLPTTNGGTGTATSTANTFFAAPDGIAGAPIFRTIVASDIPTDISGYIQNAPSSTQTASININGSIIAGSIQNTAIGNTTASSGSFTTLRSTDKLNVGVSGNEEESALLEISSSSKGFLPPRMNAYQRDAISSPTAGLVVWCTNCGASGELQAFNGAIWANMSGTAGSAVPTLSIGTDYQGGKVAYLLVSGDEGYDANTQHGIIVAPDNLSTSTTLDNAITLANNYTGGGYTNWFLPNIAQLEKVFLNRNAIGYTFGPTNSYFWSSSVKTDGSGNNYWFTIFYTPNTNTTIYSNYSSRSSTYYARAIRLF
ncbi:MAG: hypothetical protein KA534_03220 [Sediminibacterium sp.]|nr:hypothetical protein [Sediminibacterium sp.]MBP6144738.1 hypothetical protein [Sediminibacterium sp.]